MGYAWSNFGKKIIDARLQSKKLVFVATATVSTFVWDNPR